MPIEGEGDRSPSVDRFLEARPQGLQIKGMRAIENRLAVGIGRIAINDVTRLCRSNSGRIILADELGVPHAVLPQDKTLAEKIRSQGAMRSMGVLMVPAIVNRTTPP